MDNIENIEKAENVEQNNEQAKQAVKRGRPATKNGNYNTKQYYLTFKEKNKNKIHEVQQCEECGGKFSYYNKSHHNQSKRHQKSLKKDNVEVVNQDKEIIEL